VNIPELKRLFPFLKRNAHLIGFKASLRMFLGTGDVLKILISLWLEAWMLV